MGCSNCGWVHQLMREVPVEVPDPYTTPHPDTPLNPSAERHGQTPTSADPVVRRMSGTHNP